MTGSEPSHPKRKCLANEVIASSGQKVDNSGSTLQKLFQLYRQADLCDVQLQVGVRLFHAHKLILSMCSDVFKTMLTDAKWPDARKARIVLNEEPECVKVCNLFCLFWGTCSFFVRVLWSELYKPILVISVITKTFLSKSNWAVCMWARSWLVLYTLHLKKSCMLDSQIFGSSNHTNLLIPSCENLSLISWCETRKGQISSRFVVVVYSSR